MGLPGQKAPRDAADAPQGRPEGRAGTRESPDPEKRKRGVKPAGKDGVAADAPAADARARRRAAQAEGGGDAPAATARRGPAGAKAEGTTEVPAGPRKITDVIPHPGLLEWWSITVLVSVLFALLARRLPWIRGLFLLFSGIWFLLVTGYVASFVISEHPRDIRFVEVIGWSYFIQLELVALLPLLALALFGKPKRQPYRAPRRRTSDSVLEL